MDHEKADLIDIELQYNFGEGGVYRLDIPVEWIYSDNIRAVLSIELDKQYQAYKERKMLAKKQFEDEERRRYEELKSKYES
jgi:hypothetical protein